MKILEVMTEHPTPFKILIEVLKDLLPEANIQFDLDETENEDDNNEEKIKNNDDKHKTQKKKKEVYTDIDEDSDDIIETSESEEEEDDTDIEKNKKKKKINKSGMRIMAVDTTKTVLINLRLDAKNFTTFECKKKKIVLGVNLGYFHKLIKSMDKEDNLTLYVEHNDKNFLGIKIDNPEKNSRSTFKLKLLDLGNELMVVPDISFDAVVTMNSGDFHKICREMNQIADYVEIRCSSNKITFMCKGDYAERITTYDADEKGDGINIQHAANNSSVNAPLIIQGIYELRKFGTIFKMCIIM